MSDPTAPAPVTRYWVKISDVEPVYIPLTEWQHSLRGITEGKVLTVVLAADYERVVGALDLRIKELEKVTNGI